MVLPSQQDEVNTFAILSSFGVPMNRLQEYLAMEPAERKKIQATGYTGRFSSQRAGRLDRVCANG